MKKIISFALAAVLLTACGNSGSSTSKTDSSSPGTPAVDNVNGNVPDTSNTVPLNKPLPKDSPSLKDSSMH